MSTIYHDIPLQTTADVAWQRLADLDQVHELVSFLSDATVQGDRRVCKIAEEAPMSGVLDEIILGVDHRLRRVAYRIVASPFGFEHHSASMQIVENEGGARFVWTTDVKPDSVADRMADTFASEAQNIASQLSR